MKWLDPNTVLDGNRVHKVASYTDARGGTEVWLDGRIYRVEAEGRRRGAAASRAGNTLEAGMPGTVVALKAAPGDTVTAGQPLVVMESMKMEITLESPRDGVVLSVECAVGQIVQMGATLVTLGVEPQGSAPSKAS